MILSLPGIENIINIEQNLNDGIKVYKICMYCFLPFRYGKIPASEKVLNAEYHGVKGLLLYEESTRTGDNKVYEKSARSSTLLTSKFGDLMSPGWAAKTGRETFGGREETLVLKPGTSNEYPEHLIGIKNDGNNNGVINQELASSLPKIPVQPISQSAAKDILDHLEQPEGWDLPEEWTQSNLFDTNIKVEKQRIYIRNFNNKTYL